ncbi:MAG: calcium-translocating P-type ATPase, PMCA-type, Ca2+-transporting ATPase [Microgenomates group bacterium GW2011_GWC1_44_37]|nr:MAG: Cation transport ATPase [Candidatus Collierbacteria bacterium GW2011_GWA2_44_13]KKT62233.1 MAG: Cation transport ATPase [Candidatus Collierbacteria bacterium GW2011_GWD1_44_27]KKT66774.1 MAG: Cation transport ATPase [Candidatus Collierbacteria bacterium GW2011_GWC2_44_30]KKT69063.1 MAG: calcium-translocating P-type ATPase, PMCA-type, Ca2+-transporting ATPase [Microgenomates group bacterium GW2011_GWC1_44_37]KKT87930.1 MAG: Cation transport ATPase [Candidatus Collierbacteria bacterium GW
MKYVGLDYLKVKSLQQRYGPNLLPEEKHYHALSIFFSQLKSPLIYILLGVMALSLFFREYLDVFLISLIVMLNVVMGFSQEYSAQKTLGALRKIIKPFATVIRSGKRQIIEASSLVPGDIVLLGSGDNVPADGSLLEGVDMFISESILTGESEPVKKSQREKYPHLYMGTTVIGGRGTMMVEKIGTQTEIGRIGKSITQLKETQTPLQIKLERFSRTLVLIIASISILIFSVGLLLKQDLWSMFRYSIVLSVAAIPEGLPIAVTVILSLGVRRILKKEGLVKKLLSIETLGATSVICTDKTGTLTEGVMKVVKTSFKNHREAIRGLIFLNTQRTSLEIAIWNYLKKELGKDPQDIMETANILHEETFESDKKFAKTIVKVGEKSSGFIIGAPEVILNFCNETQKEKGRILYEFEDWAKSGLRVVGLCVKPNATIASRSGYRWSGLIGIMDPVRKTVYESIVKAKTAGIRVIIVTGDYLHTALKVAKEVGLDIVDGEAIEGSDLDKISDGDLRKRIQGITLFARVAPIQKLKIIEALQANGEVVAMTGDGVNDGPALKKADIGIAVGSATDVAKSASDMVLLNSDFQTIISAVEEGRIIFANIKKVVAYVLSNSFAEIVLIMGALMLNVPIPMTIVQILWVHLICDGPPDIVLGFEPKETGIMEEKPRKLISESILELPMILLIVAISLTAGLTALFAFHHIFNGTNLQLAQTVAFAVIGSIDLTYIFSYKDLKKPIYQMNLFDNKYLLGAVGYGFILLLLGIYHPMVNRLLGTTPLDLKQWIYPLLASLATILWVEVVKRLRPNQAHNP